MCACLGTQRGYQLRSHLPGSHSEAQGVGCRDQGRGGVGFLRCSGTRGSGDTETRRPQMALRVNGTEQTGASCFCLNFNCEICRVIVHRIRALFFMMVNCVSFAIKPKMCEH